MLIHFQGVLSSRGKCILFADADGATKFGDYDKLYSALVDCMAKGEEHYYLISLLGCLYSVLFFLQTGTPVMSQNIGGLSAVPEHTWRKTPSRRDPCSVPSSCAVSTCLSTSSQ